MYLLGPIQVWEGKGMYTSAPRVHSHSRWVWANTTSSVHETPDLLKLQCEKIRQPEDEWKALCFDQSSVGLKQQHIAFQSIFSVDCFFGSWTYLQLRALKYLEEKSYEDSRRNLIHKYQNSYSRWFTLCQNKTLLGMLSDFKFSNLLVELC